MGHYSIPSALTFAVIMAVFSTPSAALDVSQIVGTVSVEFRPIQNQGMLEGCTLVYNITEQDFTYKQGTIISLIGNIAFFTNKERNNIALSLKIGTTETFNKKAKGEAPHYAYVQTPHATTAKSKFLSTDSDTVGAKLFIYDLDNEAMAVLRELMDGQPVTIGFNRHEGGMDVLAKLDLHVTDISVSGRGELVRHRSDDSLQNFVTCVSDLSEQIQAHLSKK
jgi:hypothetical protein